MRTLAFSFTMALLLAGTTQAFAMNYNAEERKAQEDACGADAMALCKDDVPDEAKITACMTKNKSKLSAPCLKIFNKGGHT